MSACLGCLQASRLLIIKVVSKKVHCVRALIRSSACRSTVDMPHVEDECQRTMEIDYSLHFRWRPPLQPDHRSQFSGPCEFGGGGVTVAVKGCSEVKSIFVSVWRGLTCIQVELYESEGQSYELCRSGKKKNPADNKKTDSSSTALLLQQCYTGLHKLRSKQTKLIYKCALQWFYSYLMNVTHHECRASNTMLRMSLQSFLLSNIMKTKAGLNSRFVSLSLSVRCCQIMIQSDLFACKAVCCRFSNKGFVCCQLRTKLKQVSGKLQSSR